MTSPSFSRKQKDGIASFITTLTEKGCGQVSVFRHANTTTWTTRRSTAYVCESKHNTMPNGRAVCVSGFGYLLHLQWVTVFSLVIAPRIWACGDNGWQQQSPCNCVTRKHEKERIRVGGSQVDMSLDYLHGMPGVSRSQHTSHVPHIAFSLHLICQRLGSFNRISIGYKQAKACLVWG